MDIGAIIIIILISLLLVVTFYIIGLYNNIINAKNKIEDKFSQIETELRKKVDTAVNIIDIIKKITKHEEKLVNEFELYASKLEKAKSINDKISAAGSINRALNKIYSLEETYADLKKNKAFKTIQDKIEEIDNRINYAKTFYNDVVLDYNNLREQFPSNIIAKVFKFKEINYYK